MTSKCELNLCCYNNLGVMGRGDMNLFKSFLLSALFHLLTTCTFIHDL